MEGASQDKEERSTKNLAVFYESLGAPLLLYRNREAYTAQDEDARLWNARWKPDGATETAFHSYTHAAKRFCERQSDLNRATARFYYPIDSHLLALPRDLPDGTEPRRAGRNRIPLQGAKTIHTEENIGDVCHDDDDKDDGSSSDLGDIPSNIQAFPSLKERNEAVKRMFRDDQYNRPQLFQLQRRVRAHMLLTEEEEEEDVLRQHYVRQKLQAYTQLDTNFVPAKEKLRRIYFYERSSHTEGDGQQQKRTLRTSHRRVLGTSGIVRHQTQLYDRERLHRSQPAFLAPFHLPSLRNVVGDDIASRGIPYKKAAPNGVQELHSIPQDDPHAPTLFGNCLLVLLCQCDVCKQGKHASPCLLHPVGPMQDRLRCSYIQLPCGIPLSGHTSPRRDIPEECKVDHRIRQVELCGRDPYVVFIRTEVHCIVASITFSLPLRETPHPLDHCWGTANWRLLHRIDHRTLRRSLPSLRPLDVTSHPKYGIGSMTPSKVAAVYESSKKGTRNSVHHMQITPQSVSVQKYQVVNLQEIVEVAFASHHPMVVWCIGRSFVRPALTATYLHTRPRMGHGSALYSIDLRCTENDAAMATFHWSPSAEEFSPEGIHSLSGLHVDWMNDHCLWVSSISAGKTYCLDTRTPCRVLQSFSLPYLCDEPGEFLPPFGYYGAGTLFSQPISLESPCTSVDVNDCMLCVAKTPDAFGVHIYQTPSQRPLLHMPSVECLSGPGFFHAGWNTLSASSMIPLPDVSEQIFTCGLASFRTPLLTVCTPFSFWSQMGLQPNLIPDVLCFISLTNKGDVYAQVMLTSVSEQRHGISFDALPLGYTAIPAPLQEHKSIHPTTWNTLHLRLSNDFPIPGSAVRNRVQKRKKSEIIDLSCFVDEENRLLLRQERMQRNQRIDGVAQGEAYDDIETSEFPLEPTSATRVVVSMDDLVLRAMNVSQTESQSPCAVSLPKHLAAPRFLNRPVEHFRRIEQAHIDSVVDEERKVWRSDLTPQILDDALEENWSDFSDVISSK